MNNPLMLTFDLGTQSLRAMLVDTKGNILGKSQIKYDEPYFSIENGWAEQKPNFYFDCMNDAMVGLKKTNEKDFENIIAVTLTTIRDTVICLDKDNKPLRNIILWLDKRETNPENLPKVSPVKKALFKLVGVTDMCNMQQKQSVCNWIMANEKDIWAKTNKYVMLPGYLNYLMTGNLKDSVANQIGHIPIDYKKGSWMKKGELTRFLFDVEPEKLIDLVNPGDEIGTIKDELAEKWGIKKGLKLIATGSDKGCETLGLSVLSKDKAAVSFGTSATIQFMTKDYFEPSPFCPSYPAVVKGMYNPEEQTYRGYWMLSWFKNEFAHEEQEIALKEQISTEEVLNRYLKEVPAGSNGLILQPFWGAGVSNPNAKGAIIGFSDVQGKKHIYRAIIEGINYSLYEGLKRMSKRGKQEIKELFVGGGGSQSDEICQIAANMFGLPVSRIQTHEACGLGSSMVGFVSCGIFNSIEDAIKNMVRTKDTFKPDMKEHQKYVNYYKVYDKMYRKLEPLYINLREAEKNE